MSNNAKTNKEEEIVVKPNPKAGYESLFAPTGMKNDAMSGWRTQLGSMNDQYGGDILGYSNTDAFKKLGAKEQSQYYTDLNNYNALYGTVSGYDADYMEQAKTAKRAEEYANTRRALMERYLPETLAAMGYANTGMAGDALLKLNNAYDNYAINAQATAAQKQADLIPQYRQDALDWQSQRNAEKQSELTTQLAQEEAYIQAMQDEKDEFDWEQVETDLKLGKITQGQYDKLKENYRKIVGNLTALIKFGEPFKSLFQNELKEKIEAAKASKNESEKESDGKTKVTSFLDALRNVAAMLYKNGQVVNIEDVGKVIFRDGKFYPFTGEGE